MKLFYTSLLIAVSGNVLYHLSQKFIAPSVHPLVSVIISYLTAIVLAVPLFSVFPLQGALRGEIGKIGWPTIGVGVAILAVELAFLLAYRAGWKVSLASVTANTTVALILLPVGLLLFREHVSVTNVAGAALCLTGLVLIVR